MTPPNGTTAVERFIRDACEGGYENEVHFLLNLPEYAKCQIWIDPKAWQAVGKVRKWGKFEPTGYYDKMEDDIEDFSWKVRWHRFIDSLAQGKDIEAALEGVE